MRLEKYQSTKKINQVERVKQEPFEIGEAVFYDHNYVTIKDINKGEKLSKDNIWVKRPGTGEIKAESFNQILGTKVNENIEKDTQLKWSMLKNE